MLKYTVDQNKSTVDPRAILYQSNNSLTQSSQDVVHGVKRSPKTHPRCAQTQSYFIRTQFWAFHWDTLGHGARAMVGKNPSVKSTKQGICTQFLLVITVLFTLQLQLNNFSHGLLGQSIWKRLKMRL